ncbi:hypothetical protein Tco_0702813 [Tanacetum coccineum]|uniref:Zinc finger, CCHC-type n=1 Tax=Tanacetum coccineum TaxID=301880 RepID=A0ABQ4XYX2_9ASTR
MARPLVTSLIRDLEITLAIVAARFSLVHEDNIEFKEFGLHDNVAQFCVLKMTTSVGNNLVFRSFFEKQKLTGPNFIDWYRQLRLVLSTEDKKNYLEHPIPAAPVALPGQQVPPEALAAHAA